MSNWRKRLLGGFLLLLVLWLVSFTAAHWLIVTASPDCGDVILLLSGSSSIYERTHLAAKLYFEHRAPKIVLTNDNQMGGWSPSEERNPYYYEITSRELQKLGVPATDIDVIGTPVHSTAEEAAVMRQYCEGKNIHSVVIVTSAYHSRRALKVFRDAFTKAAVTIGIVAVPPGWQTPKPAIWWSSIRGWQLVGGEYVKFLLYEFRG
jgi:uncharacterized SAM-binding protein YcdF (DUF218 family)